MVLVEIKLYCNCDCSTGSSNIVEVMVVMSVVRDRTSSRDCNDIVVVVIVVIHSSEIVIASDRSTR